MVRKLIYSLVAVVGMIGFVFGEADERASEISKLFKDDGFVFSDLSVSSSSWKALISNLDGDAKTKLHLDALPSNTEAHSWYLSLVANSGMYKMNDVPLGDEAKWLLASGAKPPEVIMLLRKENILIWLSSTDVAPDNALKIADLVVGNLDLFTAQIKGKKQGSTP